MVTDFTTLTIVIKTIFRPNALNSLVASIKRFYPEIKINVADDSGEKITINNDVDEYFLLPFDMGLSYGRNYLIDKVQTKYFMLLDDDTLFTKFTIIEYALNILENTRIDLVAGKYYPDKYYGLQKKENNIFIRDMHLNKGVLDGYPLYDFVPNFFIAQTDKVQKIRWDNELKIQEHMDFFWRAKGQLNCTYFPYFSAINSHLKENDNYCKLRNRVDYFQNLQCQKLGNVSKIISRQNKVMPITYLMPNQYLHS